MPVAVSSHVNTRLSPDSLFRYFISHLILLSAFVAIVLGEGIVFRYRFTTEFVYLVVRLLCRTTDDC